MRLIKGMALLIAVATGSGPVLAQSGWGEELAVEIATAQHCDVAYYTHVVERVVDGRQLVMAKAHCEDKRVFDAMRPDEREPFQFNECQPDTGTAC